MSYANQQAFSDNKSRLVATGIDFDAAKAITDAQGNILAYAKTGGVMSPVRHELLVGTKIFRFGKHDAGVHRVAGGGWWMEQREFDQLFAFAQVWDLSIGMAMRMLCLVPPEWNDATLLVRARVVRPLLAWRGLGNSVVTPATGGGEAVRMPHQNDIAARRCYQLYIPGLHLLPQPALAIEQDYPLEKSESQRGFIYA